MAEWPDEGTGKAEMNNTWWGLLSNAMGERNDAINLEACVVGCVNWMWFDFCLVKRCCGELQMACSSVVLDRPVVGNDDN